MPMSMYIVVAVARCSLAASALTRANEELRRLNELLRPRAVKQSGGLLPKINPKFARDFCVFRGRCVRLLYRFLGEVWINERG
jgi:hypothetical protein